MRNKKFIRILALSLVVTFATQILAPAAAYALTSGPSQPEVQSFEPAGTSDMVDLFTGDFNYNIPLLNVGDYPINLSYHSGITMDQEASWVGLGWNINPGVINRGVRGLPDDFNGDEVQKEQYTKPNRTYGITAGGTIEIFGLDGLLKLEGSLTVRYNNYRGLGLAIGIGPKLSVGQESKGSLTVGFGISLDSEDGVGINPSLSFDYGMSKKIANAAALGFSLGGNFNSRGGLQHVGYGLTLSAKTPYLFTPAKNSDGSYQRNKKGEVKGKMSYKKSGSTSSTNGSAITIGSPAYTPVTSFPTNSFGLSLRATVGAEVFWVHPAAFLEGFYSQQKLAETSAYIPAYGFLYAHNASNGSLQDFNREKDGSFNKHKPNLPLTNFTYDTYSVNGQGIGGSYRAHRGDVGVLHDRYTKAQSGGGNIGVEIGVGNLAHSGASLSANYAATTNDKWAGTTQAQLDFVSSVPGDEDYEPAYFKQSGEMTVQHPDEDYYILIGGNDPLHLEVNTPTSLGADFGGRVYKKKRDKRNQPITTLSAKEASRYGLNKKISYYDTTGALHQMDRVDGVVRKNHHVSEVTALRPDGMRYVYGIPAYNSLKKEATFNVTSNTVDASSGLVSYTPGGEDRVGNDKGIDHFYTSTHTPGFAHSYLLTDILSTDYVDVTGNGVSDDDLGTYTKINYTKHSSAFNWRTPVEASKAFHNEGLFSDAGTFGADDDKGSYIYGVKEIWYVHSIETKNHIAVFQTSNRTDGHGVVNDGGGIETNSANTLRKLDKIILYSKQDYELNGANAEAIQTVHFDYGYTLCPGLPNSSGTAPDNGKLTLNRVYFTYGTSEKGRLNAYIFNYSDFNPSYGLKNVDRWGNYQDASQTDGSAFEKGQYPYVYQDATTANQWASAWQLTSIRLPSGGTINVEYESDDYAYVQNKKAMQMHVVAGVGSSTDFSKSTPYDLMTRDSNFPDFEASKNLFVFFPIDDPTKIDQYVEGISDLYFRFFVKLGGDKNGSYDYVPGYLDNIISHGVSSNNSYGYIELGAANGGSAGDVHPITLAAWNFARLNAPATVFPGHDAKGNAFNALSSLFGKKSIVAEVFNGINKNFAKNSHGFRYLASKSYIRLNNVTGHKYGGGSRVKQITMEDNWSQLTGNPDLEDATYGQVYDYTNYDPLWGETVSSGVAAYEPMIANDENPWRTPLVWTESKKLVPDLDHYMENPLGESFFPAPTVGYSKVSVQSYYPPGVSVNRTGTGTKVNIFYTAKDFPTLSFKSNLQMKQGPKGVFKGLFGIDANDEIAFSQGYVIEVNDMHGKSKAELTYAQNKTEPLSEVRYFYHTDDDNTSHLNNIVSVILPDGTIAEREIGKEVDMVADLRQQITDAYNVGASTQVDVALIPIPFPTPIPVPTGFPTFGVERTSFRSAVTTKVIQRYGILSHTVATQEGSTVTTRNLAWDSETGEVLLTSTDNEYGDPIYNLTYPAHWAYKGMGPAYQNIGVTMGATIDTQTGYASVDNLALLYEGDEVSLVDVNNDNIYGKAWVTRITSTQAKLQMQDGSYPSIANATLKVLRSGYRNMHTNPIATITSLEDPRVNDIITLATDRRVLQAQALEFGDNWHTFCGGQSSCEDCITEGDSLNFYAIGIKGNWRQKRAFSYVANRKQSTPVNLRTDGYFENFDPYWQRPSSGTLWTANRTNRYWTWKQRVTKFDPFGKELENVDPLNRYTAAVYGYNHTLPVIIGQNSRYNELAFEGFEDGSYNDSLYMGACKLWPHFAVSGTGGCDSITSLAAHTGTKSLSVGGSGCEKASIYRNVIGHETAEYYLSLVAPSTIKNSAHCIGEFNINADAKYVISAWTRVDQRIYDANGLDPFWRFPDSLSSRIEIVLLGACDSLGTLSFAPSGKIIEGWQRIYGEFTIPATQNGERVVAIRIDMIEDGGSGTTLSNAEGLVTYVNASYFDDLRIHPFNANVKSYVYDAITLRLRAELDNNNYATMYEYDQEGNLIRLKRETERGVQTINENRQNLPKFSPR